MADAGEGAIDIVAVEGLIERGVISEEVAVDVLAVDFANPVFSTTRCGLLKLVPDDGGADFVARLQESASRRQHSGGDGARKSLGPDEGRGLPPPAGAGVPGELPATGGGSESHRSTGTACWRSAGSEFSDSEISQNPNGHILEDPGRIVFPSTRKKAVAGRLTLTASCEVM